MKIKYFLCVFGLILLVQLCVLVYLYGKLDTNTQMLGHRLVHSASVQWLRGSCQCPLEDLPSRSETANNLVQPYQPDHDMCMQAERSIKSKADIVISELLGEVRISYPQYVYSHSGWIDKWHISYNPKQWSEFHPLRVFIVPHSHNDPGWLKTADEYYTGKASRVLDQMLDKLNTNPEYRFIWSEVVYLAQWYSGLGTANKAKFKRILDERQLEIVGGGWVMPDEAVTHYYDLILQLQQGHLWLQQHLNYTVKNGWAIDPFGLSPTMPYLLKRSGLQHLVIQRTHYALKHHLANKKQLEFFWQQAWDGDPTLLLCHLSPFLLYNIQSSCGPDSDKCCQFDFTHKKCWAWGAYQDPQPITDDNIKDKAETLLEQFRKKAQLYNHNVLLVPHGDDFRYQTASEWESQLGNLHKLISYMNSHSEMNVKVQFGTLAEYFAAVSQEKDTSVVGEGGFPRLQGDFMTYTDRDDQYWSGYYTSRPFLKHMVRHLQAYLRAAEIAFTLTMSYSKRHQMWQWQGQLNSMYEQLEMARSTQSLLQHHDAITGTARQRVVLDYLSKGQNAFTLLKHVLELSASALVQFYGQHRDHQLTSAYQSLTEQQGPQDLPTDSVIEFGDNKERVIAIFNPLTSSREELIKVKVSGVNVAVFDLQGELLPCQLNPVWVSLYNISSQQFEISFLAKLNPISITHFLLRMSSKGSIDCTPADIITYNQNITVYSQYFSIIKQDFTHLSLENKLIRADFCHCTGLLKSVYTKLDHIQHRTMVKFAHYGTGSWNNPWRDKSGAYVFMPDGPAKEMQYSSPPITVLRGPLMSSVITHLRHVSQHVSLLHSQELLASSLLIENILDIRQESNFELAMRVYTDLESNDGYFYTDLNSYQVHRRRHMSHIPLQGNVYPMTSACWLEDSLFRISVLSTQSQGISSSSPGMLEVMLDRRLMQDDWRGLGEGVQDNVVTLSRFRLLVESRITPVNREHLHNSLASFPSILSHMTNHMTNYPPIKMLRTTETRSTLPNVDLLTQDLPCDLHLVTLRSHSSTLHFDPLLVLHRLSANCDFRDNYQPCENSNGKLNLDEIFKNIKIDKAFEMTLSGNSRKSQRDPSIFVAVNPMDINVYKLSIS